MAAPREPVLFDLSRSSDVYRGTRRLFGFHRYLHPIEAHAAMRDMLPWEALLLSALAAAIGVGYFGIIDGVSLGMCVALALVTFQMLRERAFVTATRLVRRRGLIVPRGFEIPLGDIQSARVEWPPHERRFGTVVVRTVEGAEYRFQAVRDAEQVAHLLSAGGSHGLG